MEQLTNYDSTPDTLFHIKRVNELLGNACIELIKRGQRHDDSKLKDPEKKLFDELTPLLKDLTYGSPEYKESLAKLKPALDHHYANNRHHTEFFDRGVNEMNLFDLIEMFFDWKAASERHNDGNIRKSIDINRDRYKLDEAKLSEIFKNTVNYLGW